jgi:hypothetical protein
MMLWGAVYKNDDKRLLTQDLIQSHFTTDYQSVSPSWCRAPSGAHDQILFTDCKEDTASNNSSIVEQVSVARKRVYRAVT